MNKRRMALVLVGLMLVPVAAGLLGLGHTCAGEECLFCAAIRRSLLCLNIAFLFGVSAVHVRLILRCGAQKEARMFFVSPVAARVRLND